MRSGGICSSAAGGRETLTIPSFIQQYGYLALFVGTFLEGEVVLIVAGFAAHQGYLSLPGVIVAATGGNALAGQVAFLLGRWKGEEFLAKRPSLRGRVDRAKEMLTRYGDLLVPGSRFVYGTRTVTPLALGISRMGSVRFSILNALSALLWAALVGTGGYLFGKALTLFVGRLQEVEIGVMAAIVLLGAAVWMVRRLRGRDRFRGPKSPR